MKYLGVTCSADPEHGNERYRFSSGRTVCARCHLKRQSVYRCNGTTDAAIAAREKRRRDRLKTGYRRKMAQYRRIHYMERRARLAPPKIYARWRKYYELSLRIPDLDDRLTYLRPHYVAIVLPALAVV